jgi:hypothetical protein
MKKILQFLIFFEMKSEKKIAINAIKKTPNLN